MTNYYVIDPRTAEIWDIYSNKENAIKNAKALGVNVYKKIKNEYFIVFKSI